MYRRFRRTAGFIIKITLLLIFIGMGLFVFRFSDLILDNINMVLREQIQEAVDFDVEWERVLVFPVNHLVFRDVSLALPGEESFLEAERVVVRYRLWDIIRGQVGVVESITEVGLRRVAMDLTRWDGGFEEISLGDAGEFNGNIVIQEGEITFALQDRLEKLADISGSLKPKTGGGWETDLQGSSSAMPGSIFNVTGSFSPGDIAARVDFSGMDAPYLMDFIELEEEFFQVQEGKLQGFLELDLKDLEITRYHGNIFLEQGQVGLQEIITPVTGLQGSFIVSPEGLEVEELCGNLGSSQMDILGRWDYQEDFQMQLNSKPFFLADLHNLFADLGFLEGEISSLRGQGTLDLNMQGKISDPSLRGQIVLEGLEAREWQEILEKEGLIAEGLPVMDGEGSLDLSLRGTLGMPDIRGSMEFPAVNLGEMALKDFFLNLQLDRDLLVFESVRGKLGDGFLQLRGSVRFLEVGPYFSFNFDLENIDLAHLHEVPFPQEISRQGLLSGRAFASGYIQDLPRATSMGSLTIEDARVLDYELAKGETSFWFADGELLMSPLVVTDPLGGEVRLQGVIDLRGNYDYLVEAEKVDLGAYLPTLKGQAWLKGQLTGSLDEPCFEGEIVGRDIFYEGNELGQIEGKINAAGWSWQLEDVQVNHSLGQATLAGLLEMGGEEPRLNLNVKGQGDSLKSILDFMDYDLPVQVEGSLEGDINIYGELSDLGAQGCLTLHQGLLDQQEFETLNVSLNWQGQDLEVNSFRALVAGGEITGKGNLSLNGPLDLEVGLENVALDKIALLRKEYPGLGGNLSFKGEVAGSLGSPEVSGLTSVSDLMWEGNKVGNAQGNLHVYGERAYFQDLDLLSDGGGFTVKGRLDFLPEIWLDLDIEVEDEGLQEVGVFLGEQGEIISQLPFTSSGTARITGQGENPLIDFFARMDFQGGWLEAKGGGPLQGPYEARLEGQGLDLAELQEFLPEGYDLQGKGDVNLLVEYDGEQLKLIGENYFQDVSYDGFYLGDCQGEFRQEGNDSLSINQRIDRNGDLVTVRGQVPLEADVMGLILDVKSHSLNLDFLADMVPGAFYTAGTAELSIMVTGSLEQPQYRGYAHIKDGGFEYLDIPGTFQDITGTIQFRGDQMVYEDFKGVFNQTGSVAMEGYMYHTGWEFSYYDLDITGKELPVNHGAVSGYTDGNLKVIGPYFTPSITGELQVYNTVIRYPFYWPHEPPGEEPSPFEPHVAVTLKPRGNVWVKNNNFEFLVQQGSLQLDNRTGYFELVGEVSSRQGSFHYYNTNFRLMEGRARFLRFNESIPHLNIRAQTRIQDTRVDLHLDGPALDMNIRLTSSPPMPEAEIIDLLVRRGGLGRLLSGDIGGVFLDEFWRLVGEGIHTGFIMPLETSLEEALGLDEFSLYPSLSRGEEKLSLHMGKSLTDRIYLTYSQTFFGDRPYRQLGVEYRLLDNLILEGFLQDEGHFQIRLDYSIPF